MNRKRRKAFLDEIKNINCYKKCVLFVVPVELCESWNRNRKRKVPEKVFDKMLKQFQCPYYYEGFYEIKAKGTFITPYSFPFADTVSFSQDNPHHKMNLLGECKDSFLIALLML